jgi:hypothetical protein
VIDKDEITSVTPRLVSNPGRHRVCRLDPGYPNPFNGAARIRFSIPCADFVSVDVYNVAGEKIATLVRSMLTVGSHTVSWDGTDSSGARQPSGVYFCRLSIGDSRKTIRMTLLR